VRRSQACWDCGAERASSVLQRGTIPGALRAAFAESISGDPARKPFRNCPIINGAKDDEVPLEGGMSRNPLVRNAQSTAFKPLREVVDFWVKANKPQTKPKVATSGTATTNTYDPQPGGAVTESIVDSEGGHGWPGARVRREGNTPILSFKGAERVWAFFKGKSRAQTPPKSPSAP
jgi:poly(3-hydroxybutyrate) depolymerase